MGTPDIKVITGVQRSGKSKLMESFMDWVGKNMQDANIIRIDFNMNEFESLEEYHALEAFVNKSYIPGKRNFVVIDEVQMCRGFEKAICSLHASEKYDIYITGSNAFLLSSGLATLFTGRTFAIEVYPFSFAEFMKYYELADPQRALSRYVKEGGMAGSYTYSTLEMKYDYIATIFNTLVIRDIKQKYRIRNMPAMERLSDFLMGNISNQTSARAIGEYFKNKKNSDQRSHPRQLHKVFMQRFRVLQSQAL